MATWDPSHLQRYTLFHHIVQRYTLCSFQSKQQPYPESASHNTKSLLDIFSVYIARVPGIIQFVLNVSVSEIRPPNI